MTASFSVLCSADAELGLDRLAERLVGFGVVPAGERLGLEQGRSRFSLRVVPGPIDDAIAKAAVASGHRCSRGRWGARIEVEIADLRVALDEINPLIELQALLQEHVDGHLYLSWNDRVSAPHRADQPATPQKVWAAASKLGLTKPLQAAGFTKQGNDFVRRHGTATQRVSVRARKRGDLSEHDLMVGWDLDEALALGDTSAKIMVGREPVMFHQSLLAGEPSSWLVAADTRVDDLRAELQGVIGRLLERLDLIDGPRGMLEHVDLSRGFDKLAHAQLRYLLGDHERAADLVRATCDEFADRELDFDETAARLGLSMLVGRG